MKLDVIDKKILLVLMNNGRISTTELAKAINHNYPTVRNRVNKLIENGVIRHFYPVLQIPGIGARRYMSIYLNLKNITKEEQGEIFNKLAEHPFLIEVSELQGRWNVSLLLVCNYVKEAYDTLNFIQQLCGKYLTDLIVMPTYMISNLNRRFFADFDFSIDNIKTGYSPLIKKTPLVFLGEKLKWSGDDVKLLDYIKLNARAGLGEIGKDIGMDPTLVDYKLKRFISKNLIKYFSAEIDSSVLGYEQYLLFLNLRGLEDKKKEIIEELKGIKEAYHYFEYLNYWEIVVTFCVKNRESIHKIFSDLQAKYGEHIKDHEILWLIKKHKIDPYPSVKDVYLSN